MIRVIAVLVCAMSAASAQPISQTSQTLSVVIPHPCALASIAPDNTVTVDWDCVDKNAAEYATGKSSYGVPYPAFALIMKAIRDGAVKPKAP